MNDKLFTTTKTGKLVWVPNGAYYRFEPNKLPLKYKPSFKLTNQMTKTLLALGGLKSLSLRFTEEEIKLMQYPFMIKEAQLSSEIEGTRSTISDVYKGRKIEETNIEKKLDNEEISNYEKALKYSLNNESRKISKNLLKEMHKILLKGVRGSSKTPGEYKTEQNAVGNREDTFDTAKFVPASPETTPELMDNLLKFINAPSDFDPLYKIAITHYQFEAIHPFRDGNGRLGRLLIMLQICREELLNHPLLYVSEFFNRNRDTYIDSLFEVSSKGNIEEWVLFFFKSLEYQANHSLILLDKLNEYKQELHREINKISQTKNIHLLVNYFFREPFFSIKDVVKILEISQPASWNVLKKLKENNIIKDVGIYKKAKIYKAHKIIDIIEGKI